MSHTHHIQMVLVDVKELLQMFTRLLQWPAATDRLHSILALLTQQMKELICILYLESIVVFSCDGFTCHLRQNLLTRA